MDGIKQWALCLIVSAAAATLMSLMSPRGAADKTMKIVVGVFVISAVCSPIAELEKDGFDLPAFSGVENLEGSYDDLTYGYTAIIKNVIDSHVKEAAEEFEISSYEVSAEIEQDETGCIIIHKIAVFTAESNKTKLNAFSSALNERLGVGVSVEGEREGSGVEGG